MPVPILDLTAHHAPIASEITAAMQAVVDSGAFILGPAVTDLERRVAEYCGAAHGVGVASGTDALHLALLAAGVGPGHEVITSPFTFIATGNAITHCGATPVFADIRRDTFNIDPDRVAEAVTPRTRAIMPVHLYGQPADMDAILAIARQHGLAVIEDAAQAIGARWHGRPVGALGGYGCLSFFPTKNLGGFGDGGMVLTNGAEGAGRVAMLRGHGSRRKYHAEIDGFNSRLDSIQAAVLGVKLNSLPRWTEGRRRAAAAYRELLAGAPLTLPVEAPGCFHVYNQFTVRTPRRDELSAWLHSRGVANMIYYPVPLHLQPVYAGLGLGPGAFPEAERAAAEVLSLPVYPELTQAALEEVADAVRSFPW